MIPAQKHRNPGAMRPAYCSSNCARPSDLHFATNQFAEAVVYNGVAPGFASFESFHKENCEPS
jgi:hypothetical protein